MVIVVRTLSERVFEIDREQIVSGKLPKDAAILTDLRDQFEADAE
ncbi:MAG: hypothetical protein ABI821_08490 [Pseudomonadota bacterium]